jgi:DNA-binding NtrC family response regulator
VNILVIEDNEPFARLLAAMLAQDSEAHVVEHRDALATGLACLAERPFDVVLADLGLPDSKGLATFRAVRDRAGNAPVIVISGADDDAVAIDAVRDSAADYLVKGGLTYRGLRRVLHQAVERHRLIAERDRLIHELRTALADVKMLRGILPICAACKQVRDDSGAWQQIESYVREHSEADFSHGICPACAERLYGREGSAA